MVISCHYYLHTMRHEYSYVLDWMWLHRNNAWRTLSRAECVMHFKSILWKSWVTRHRDCSRTIMRFHAIIKMKISCSECKSLFDSSDYENGKEKRNTFCVGQSFICLNLIPTLWKHCFKVACCSCSNFCQRMVAASKLWKILYRYIDLTSVSRASIINCVTSSLHWWNQPTNSTAI